MEFQINRRNKWEVWRMMVFGLILYIIAVIFFLFMPLGWIGILGITIYTFLIGVGPGFYLYKEYMRYNQNCLFSISIENKELLFTDVGGGNSIKSSFNGIEKIIIYIPPNNYRNTVTFSSMEDFSYARFELKNGKEFYVTCLMIPKLKDFVQKNFSGVPVDFHRWWIFPSIRLVNYCRRKSNSSLAG